MQKNTEFFLYDVSGYKKFLSSLKGLLAEFKKSKQDYFQDWCETTLSNISEKNQKEKQDQKILKKKKRKEENNNNFKYNFHYK